MANSVYGPSNRPVFDPVPIKPGRTHHPVQEIRWSYPGEITDEALIAGGLGPVWYPFSAINLVQIMATMTVHTAGSVAVSLCTQSGAVISTVTLASGVVVDTAIPPAPHLGGLSVTGVGDGVAGLNLALLLRYRYGTIEPEVS